MALSQLFDMSTTLNSPAHEEIQSTQNTDKTLVRLLGKENQQSSALCFGSKCTSRHVMDNMLPVSIYKSIKRAAPSVPPAASHYGTFGAYVL